MKKRLSVLAAAGLMALACLTGCDSSKNASTTVIESGNAPQAHKEEVTLPPGVEYTGVKGEEFVYEKTGLKITFSELALTSDHADSNGNYTYAVVFSATNDGKETESIRMLDDFQVSADGVDYDESMYTAISAANGALAYSGYSRYDADLEPGESITGFVPFSIDSADWKTMTITYIPALKKSNDTIVYTVDRSDVVNKY